MPFPLDFLPAPLREQLVAGSVGASQCMALADAMLVHGSVQSGAAGALFLKTGCDMLLAAWENDVLHGGLAATLTALHGKRPFLVPRVAELAGRVAASWREPEAKRYLERLLNRRETDKLFSFIEQQAAREPGNLYWLQQAVGLGVYEWRLDWVASRVAAFAADQGLAPVLDWLRGDLAFLRGAYGEALALYDAVYASVALPLVAERAAEAACRLGGRDRALAGWRGVLAHRPWHVNLLLRAHDVATGADRETALPEGRGAVLLYTYNKAQELDMTLKALHASDLGGATVMALDNGCGDETSAVLARWRERFGAARFSSVSLPVNVGAPAARNWLMRSPDAAACDWLAYLDDDALVPRDWLGRLGAAMRAYPEAGVWGCRVMDHAVPALFQCTDLHLGEPDGDVLPASRMPQGSPRSFGLSNVQHQVMDFGQFAYMRPCVSVTGCCHLFLRGRLHACGDFDLRYSPSQYDDLDHDLRLGLAGRLPVYQGHLAVPHMKRSGRASQSNPREIGNALSNNYKLHMKHDAESMRQLRGHALDASVADIAAKAARFSRKAGEQG